MTCRLDNNHLNTASSMNSLKGKHFVVGITGSIAAYKTCSLIRLLIKAGAEVQVVITPAGKEFITPITLSALTSKPVISEFFSQRDGSWHSHVDLGLWADAMIIAPATASTIGKMAHGIADNMLITTYLSMKAPVFVAPAMDLDMYRHPSTVNNLNVLRTYGNHIIEAADGELASHLVGKGRMEEPEKIFEVLSAFFNDKQSEQLACNNDLAGKRILITAGPTHEKLDAVRFIGNYSTGKMGFALAESCANRGAEVELIAGPVELTVDHPHIHRTDVVSAQEMFEAATSLFPSVDAGILCAAVADFTPIKKADHKIKREGSGNLHLELQPTQDIAATLGKLKTAKQHLVGFALETDNERHNACDKLRRKNLDFIVLNSLNDKGAGFAYDTNKVTILTAQGKTMEYPIKSKKLVADDIVEELVSLFKQ
jgi:phosphopantothenoylcysteine decarboxylase/phosphopantothenate--cysteine ligase